LDIQNDNLKPSEVCTVFVKTSFLDISLAMCCLAGLNINFLTTFAWGILTKWLKTWGHGNKWDPMDAEVVANIVFWYAIPKGCLQFISGFISDLIGRKYTVGLGLLICSLSVFAMAALGDSQTNQDSL